MELDRNSVRTVVCKFGGTSMADQSSTEQVADIVKSDPARRFIVVSAPGRTQGGKKVTDLLMECDKEISETGRCDKTFPQIEERFRPLHGGISDEAFDRLMKDIKEQIESRKSRDFCISRGEYLCAYLFAAKIGFPFIDAAELIAFNRYDGYDSEKTERQCRARLKNVERAVIPGFYGADETGAVMTFSRGGSDITGSILAQIQKADLYENWTDVDGILNADPHIVPEARIIDAMTYSELRELSYLGACVMHPDALLPIVKAKIPLNVRNTFHPDQNGTLVCSNIHSTNRHTITGIAGKKDFRILWIHKIGLNTHKGFVRKVLSILEYHGIVFEHMPASLDTMNILIPYASMQPCLAKELADEIKESIHPDSIQLLDKIAIVSIVGRNMFQRVGIAAKMLTALSDNRINIRMLIQGCREINVIAGIDESNYERAVRALFDAFLAADEA